MRRLKGLPHVVGYDTMNEPSPGYIGWPDLNTHGGLLCLGESPTPFQAMLLGAGFPQQVEVWHMGLTGLRRRGWRLLNPSGVRAWQEGHECIWRENGVWDLAGDGTPRLLRPDHFARVGDRVVDFVHDYLRPFLHRFAAEVRAVDPEAILFLEAPPRQPPPHWDPTAVPNVVHAPHWYDGLTLATKWFIPFLGLDFDTNRFILGRKRVQRSFAAQLARLQAQARERMGGIPTFIGEFGIPFDLQGGRAYHNGDFSLQAQAMDRSFRALEANLLSGTLWNYTADNDNCRGDQWNGEDLSIFSRDQQTDPDDINSGGRALEAVVRPYARKVAGEPLEMSFDYRHHIFQFTFRHDPAVQAPTEIFVPRLHYPDGGQVWVSDGEYERDEAAQVLLYRHSLDRPVHHVGVYRRR